ncbi:MAG TPA: GrpB family protein [Polyangia bacterium]|nr:GrpB family protein [Polyangia bacterium]
MSLDEPVEIAEFDPRLARAYRGERDRLRLGLATASLKFEHIGSTAVPGLAGKPIVDLMLGASAPVWATREELRPRLVALGYEDLGEAGVPGRLYFRRRTALRAFNVALVEEGGEHWRANLAFRDYLRAHPEEAAAYANAKREAIAGGATTLLAYSAAKAAAIDAMLKKALGR